MIGSLSEVASLLVYSLVSLVVFVFLLSCMLVLGVVVNTLYSSNGSGYFWIMFSVFFMSVIVLVS